MLAPVDLRLPEKSESRTKWGHHWEFLLSGIGYTVGLDNICRFPVLCYKHGVTFLLVYLFLQLTIGKPLYFMELAMSQYASKGPVRVWDMLPVARGIGLSMCLISLNIALYYNINMAYVLYYFFASFMPTLPWTVCEEEYGDTCFSEWNSNSVPPVCPAPKGDINISTPCTCSMNETLDKLYPNCSKIRVHAASLFFDKKVIQESANLSDFGTPSWKLALLALVSWIIISLCLIKGIRSTGKVVYFSATFPYLMLLILLVRATTLDGALDGVEFFLFSNWSKMTDTYLWIDATGHIFFSLGLSTGGVMMLGSYNHFHHPVYKDSVIISTMDLVTNVIAGFVLFSMLGHMCNKTGQGIFEIVKPTYGMIFVAYSESLSTLSVPNLWNFIFFFMFYTLGLDSQFTFVETVCTYLIDDFVWCRHNKTALRLWLGVILYALEMALICPGGQYIMDIFDCYGTRYPLCLISLLETVSVMWVYGIERFLDDLQYMLGKKPAFLPYWYFVWTLWSPLFLSGMFITLVGNSKIPTYKDGSEYGPGVLACCWTLYYVTLSPVPIWFILHTRTIYNRYRKTGNFQVLIKLIQPSHRWGPADGTHEAAIKRENTIWADVLHWEIFRAQILDESVSIAPIQSSPESSIEMITTTPAGIEIIITPAFKEDRRKSHGVDPVAFQRGRLQTHDTVSDWETELSE